MPDKSAPTFKTVEIPDIFFPQREIKFERPAANMEVIVITIGFEIIRITPANLLTAATLLARTP